MSVISVIACGPSALKCGAGSAPGFRIGVNDAYRHVDCNSVVSMDGRWFENRHQDFYGVQRWTPNLWIRKKTLANRHVPGGFFDPKRYGPKNFTFENERCAEFSAYVSHLNGENSGHCALNLAYLHDPEVVYLYGFDMMFENGSDHFFGDYEWKGEGCSNSIGKFAKWVADMEVAAQYFDRAGIKVYNTNPDSAVPWFSYGVPEND